MPEIIKHQDGSDWFEVEVAPVSTELRGVGETVERAATNIREAGEVIAKTASEVLTSMRAGLHEAAPDTVELTFGVILGAEGGLPFVTKASAEATFSVKLTWKNDASPAGNQNA